jgi:probable F420-dependent oxidoreductase
MLFGVTTFATDYSIRPDDLARWLEERGFESLWLPEHTHIPVCRRTPFPDGGELPVEYSHTLDPFISLTVAAHATSRLRIATGICLVIERDPIVTAKQVATLDRLSDGRFIFGIGAGWNAEEMENHGTSFRKRWGILRERVLAMKRVWTDEDAEFHGEFVSFDGIWSFPKPFQKPHPPVILGADGPTTLDRVVDYCDGWMPIGSASPGLPEKIRSLRLKAEEAGRDPLSISISVFDAEPTRPAIERMRAAGVDRLIFLLPSAGKDNTLGLLDSYATLIA